MAELECQRLFEDHRVYVQRQPRAQHRAHERKAALNEALGSDEKELDHHPPQGERGSLRGDPSTIALAT